MYVKYLLLLNVKKLVNISLKSVPNNNLSIILKYFHNDCV